MAVEKLLPQNVEAEVGVLGSLLIDPEAVVQVADFLRPEDFYRDAHRAIFQAVLDLYEAGRAADLITLSDELARRGKLDEIGGISYVSSLANQVPTYRNIKQYAQIVERTAILRRLIHAAGQIAGVAYNDPDADEALEQAEKLIYDVSQRSSRSEFDSVGNILRDYLDKLDQLHERRGSIVGVGSGFSDLDKMTGGLQKSDLLILAARPAVGKSAFALSLAHNTALRYSHSVALFSLEMSKEQLVARLLSMDAGVDQHSLRTGYITDDEWDRISESVGRLSEAKIYIDDTPNIPLVEMRSKARRLMMERGFDLLVVDYLQLMQGSGGGNGRHENRVQEISEISRGLKGLARELNVPVLALSQLSRSVESRTDKKPQLSDLRECVIGSTKLIDARSGRWVPITEIHRGDEIIGMGAHQQLGRFAVDDVWSTGVKPTFTLTTRTGRTVTATANHPLYTPTGWKALGELQPGDTIATALRLPAHGREIAERAEFCRLLGYLTGDGTYQKHRGIGFISADPLTLEDANAIVQQAFPDVQVREKPVRGRAREVYYTTVFDNGFGKPDGNPLREWLRSLDVLGQRDYQKHVPGWVFDAGAVGASQFLAGYLATDGCVKTRVGKNGVARWAVHFDTVSLDLARDVQALLLRIGVISRVDQGRFNSKSVRTLYRVTVAASPDNLRRFAAAVPARGKKRLLLDAMCEQIPEAPTHRSGFFGLPAEISTLIAEQSGVAGMHWTETWRDQGRRMRRETCIEWAERLNSDELRDWAASDLLWEDVLTIEPSGEQEVFDIHVPGCNNFLANGIVAHNSGAIEQDADIVMFIYRDEVYNPDTDRKNIADIIVAKHRNGPIGQISLYFQAAQTRYRDLDLRTPGDEY